MGGSYELVNPKQLQLNNKVFIHHQATKYYCVYLRSASNRQGSTSPIMGRPVDEENFFPEKYILNCERWVDDRFYAALSVC